MNCKESKYVAVEIILARKIFKNRLSKDQTLQERKGLNTSLFVIDDVETKLYLI